MKLQFFTYLIILPALCSCLAQNKKALIVVDMQNCFLEGDDKTVHSLPVKGGKDIVLGINKAMKKFDLVVATQDWHPSDHVSFASNHPGRRPFEVITLKGGQKQTLWPDHCVINTKGAEWAKGLESGLFDKVVQKGSNKLVDSYSGFFDNAKGSQTELAAYLKKMGVDEIYVLGLAADYCVKYTALDGSDLGLKTYFVKNLTKAVDPSNLDKVYSELRKSGVKIIHSDEIDF